MMKHYLAEHRTIWADAAEDIHIHMFTGPLRVRAMCKREVILFIDMQDILFHVGSAFSEYVLLELVLFIAVTNDDPFS